MTAAMTALDVRLEQLPRMRVACARATGPAPEIEAWRRLRSWAEPQGLLNDPEEHPIFGFNHPNDGRSRSDHAYEFWIVVNGKAQPSPGIEFKEFEGGWFAVAKTRLSEASDTWKDLWDWVKDNRYRWRRTHELEKVRTAADEVSVELYLPIQP